MPGAHAARGSCPRRRSSAAALGRWHASVLHTSLHSGVRVGPGPHLLPLRRAMAPLPYQLSTRARYAQHERTARRRRPVGSRCTSCDHSGPSSLPVGRIPPRQIHLGRSHLVHRSERYVNSPLGVAPRRLGRHVAGVWALARSPLRLHASARDARLHGASGVGRAARRGACKCHGRRRPPSPAPVRRLMRVTRLRRAWSMDHARLKAHPAALHPNAAGPTPISAATLAAAALAAAALAAAARRWWWRQGAHPGRLRQLRSALNDVRQKR